jgi:glutaredoxin/glutathione-dependent peroxiredoxin
MHNYHGIAMKQNIIAERYGRMRDRQFSGHVEASCNHPLQRRHSKNRITILKGPIMTIAVGEKIPSSNFVQPTADGLNPVSSDAFFAGRRIALFSVPGAYTPTCSAKHLPGFVEQASAIKAKGIDEIACTAVNDAFVMGAWGKASGVDDSVTMLADGNGDFVKAIGLEMDGTKFGMGTRGQRFAMIVNDGVVEQLHVEAPGEFRVSAAEYVLEHL